MYELDPNVGRVSRAIEFLNHSMGFGTGKRDGLDLVSFLSSCRNRNQGHSSYFGNRLTPTKHQHSLLDRPRRKRNRAIPVHRTRSPPKSRNSTAVQLKLILSRLQTGSLWLPLTHEGERHCIEGSGMMEKVRNGKVSMRLNGWWLPLCARGASRMFWERVNYREIERLSNGAC